MAPDEEEQAAEEEAGESASPAEGQKKEEKHEIASRGIPASECLYLPGHASPELRSFQDANENPTRNIWSLDEVINFIFPKKYQHKYNEIAVLFVQMLLTHNQISGSQINEFVKENNFSKATFYNRVLPRLKRVGLIKVERATLVSLESKRKFRPMFISLSKTFGNYLLKIGDSWLAIVDDSRSRIKQQERMQPK